VWWASSTTIPRSAAAASREYALSRASPTSAGRSGRLAPDTVLVTIPEAERERLDAVVEACRRADIQCRFVRRHIDLDPSAVLGATAE